MYIDYPYRFSPRGQTSTTTQEEHIRDLIEQVLFTSPGERVNRPTFGSGLMQLLFSPNSNELAVATQLVVQGSLQQWLGELILVEAVETRAEDASLWVSIRYVIRSSQERRTAEFRRPI